MVEADDALVAVDEVEPILRLAEREEGEVVVQEGQGVNEVAGRGLGHSSPSIIQAARTAEPVKLSAKSLKRAQGGPCQNGTRMT